MNKIKSYMAMAALLLASFTSCAVEQDGTSQQNIKEGHGTKVTIKLNNGTSAKTRATAGSTGTLTGADRENQITNLYAVLYKDKNSSYAYYKTFACTHDTDPGHDNEYTFNVEDADAGGVYYMYLVANPTTALKAIFDADNSGGEISTEQALYSYAVTPVLGPATDITTVENFVMTSPRTQIDMKGNAETVVDGDGSGIVLTRLAVRIDIDATALNITNADPAKSTTFAITKVTMNTRYTESDLMRGGSNGLSMGTLATASNVEFSGFTAVTDYIETNNKYWKGAIYSCENYDTSNPTILTIEGVYKHGENQAMNISQQVVFRDIVRDGSGNITSQDVIPLQRNHLYKVVLTPKYNLGALEFEKMDYAIQVVDWQKGETIKFTGDANLTATSTPDFEVVSGAVSVVTTNPDGKTNPTTVVATSASASTVRMKVTSQTTGTMLECPEFDSSKGRYDLVGTSNDSDGNLVELYDIQINENVLASDIYTFTITNAINTSMSRTFMLSGAAFRSNTVDVQPGDVYYANDMWSRAADYATCRTISNPVGVITPKAAKVSSETDFDEDYCIKPYSSISVGDIYYAAGFWSSPTSSVVTACKAVSTPVALIYSTSPTTSDNDRGFHAYAMALKDASNGCMWATTETSIGVFSPTAYYLDDKETTISSYNNDRDGYSKMLAVMEIENWATNYPAFSAARNYSETAPGSSSGWYLPTVGQMKDFYLLMINLDDSSWQYANTNGLWSAYQYTMTHNFSVRLSNAGLVLNTDYTYFFEHHTVGTINKACWLASEYNNKYAYSAALKANDNSHLHLSPNGYTSASNEVWNRSKTNSNNFVRAVIAF